MRPAPIFVTHAHTDTSTSIDRNTQNIVQSLYQHQELRHLQRLPQGAQRDLPPGAALSRRPDHHVRGLELGAGVNICVNGLWIDVE